ncbi:MAG TPA: SpoIID/LytB domain-containing protein [Candidatus Dependentiae bacterium]|nr:SpoIID/LytB domain-containing protein [Candidatus Dependentiae bacterium]HRQ62337.1 SpoIID/LytB domain-containing protein [Candidatus Dependentiae bacterium]
MKFHYKLIVCLFLVMQSYVDAGQTRKKQTVSQLSCSQIGPIVHHVYKDSAWMLVSSESGFVISDATKKCVLRNEQTLSIMTRNGLVWVNGNRMPGKILNIYPMHNTHMFFNNTLVAGITIQREKKQVLVNSYYNESSLLDVLTHNTWLDIPEQGAKKVDQLAELETQPVLSHASASRALNVRVLLDECDHTKQHSWELLAPAGFLVHDDVKKVCYSYDTDTLIIKYHKGAFYINGKKMPGLQLFVRPKGAHIGLHGNTYQGGLWFVQHKKHVYLINCLEIEDYVFAVLRTESWPGWPLEVNKVFAIASRTYVVSMVLNAKKSKRLYHVKNTSEHQTYAGFHSCPVIRKAVEETKGIFLAHKQKPIVAMFDCCCGGIIPAHMEGINFDEAPYLARGYACTHCRNCRMYAWRAEYTHEEFENIIKQRIHDFSKLKNIEVKRYDLAGVVQETVVHSPVRKVVLSGKEFYRLHKDIKSFAFSVQHTSDRIIFTGNGLGHHIGLCQWGARAMVSDGWDYKKILEFYYPGTEFMKLT